MEEDYPAGAGGGIGVRDPGCAIDAAKIRVVIKNMRIKRDQPWAKWMRRKEQRLKDRWGVEELYGYKPNKKKREDLKEDCLFESTMRIWYELEGSVELVETKEEKKMWQIKRDGYILAMMTTKEQGILREIQKNYTRDLEMRNTRGTEIGLKIRGKWKSIQKIQSREIYEELKSKRYGKRKEDEMKTNHATTTIKRMLTPKERQFWWKVAYKLIQPNRRKSKWLRMKNGEKCDDKCPVCKEKAETWEHMEYECEVLQEYQEAIRTVYEEYVIKHKTFMRAEKWRKPTIAEWRLEPDQKMSTERMVVIAKARWVFHRERARCDYRQRRRVRISRLMDRLREEMEMTR